MSSVHINLWQEAYKSQFFYDIWALFACISKLLSYRPLQLVTLVKESLQTFAVQRQGLGSLRRQRVGLEWVGCIIFIYSNNLHLRDPLDEENLPGKHRDHIIEQCRAQQAGEQAKINKRMCVLGEEYFLEGFKLEV